MIGNPNITVKIKIKSLQYFLYLPRT